jgi:hypothetical protein
MTTNILIRLSVIVALAGLSLHFLSAPSTSQDLSAPSEKADKLLSTAACIERMTNETNKIIDVAKQIHTEVNYFSTKFLSPKDLTFDSDTKVLIQDVLKSFQDVVDLDSNTDFSGCKPLLQSIETCSNWTTAPTVAAARIILKNANESFNFCIQDLDTIKHQQATLHQLAKTIVDKDYATKWFDARISPNMKISSSPSLHEYLRQAGNAHLLFARLRDMKGLGFKVIEAWRLNSQKVPKSFLNIRSSLLDFSESVASLASNGDACLAGECDECLEVELLELARFCKSALGTLRRML